MLKPGAKVIDLGAAPGGWAQVAAQRVGAERAGGSSRSISSTWQLMTDVEFLKLDFLDAGAPEQLRALLGGRLMLFSRTWLRIRPAIARPINCASSALRKPPPIRARGAGARRRVSQQSVQGGTEADLLAMFKRNFAIVKHVKPSASRTDSAELYVLATGFRINRRYLDRPCCITAAASSRQRGIGGIDPSSPR